MLIAQALDMRNAVHPYETVSYINGGGRLFPVQVVWQLLDAVLMRRRAASS